MVDNLDFKLVRTHPISQLKDAGPLHTILQESDGGIYYTDTINHTLAAISADGRLRWQRTVCGSDKGELRYPAGFGFGWVQISGRLLRCIAIADSWNARVQFLGFDGTYIFQWNKAGAIEFGEIVDIRFIGNDFVDGYWLVLDCTKHCLYAIDPAGDLLFQIGEYFPPQFESRWRTTGIISSVDILPEGITRDPGNFAPLFYPQRIYGNTVDGLFLWEPGSMRLKQALLGNLLPVWLESPLDGKWICADANGLLSWSSAHSILSFYEAGSGSWLESRIEGIPISAGRRCDEIWIQHEDRLEYRCRQSNPSCAGIFSALRRNAHEIESYLSSKPQPKAVAYLNAIAERMADLCRKTMAAAEVEPGQSVSDTFDEEFVSLCDALSTFTPELHNSWHVLFLGLLKLRLLQYLWPEIRDQEAFVRSYGLLQNVTLPLANMFVALAESRGDLIDLRVTDLTSHGGKPRLAARLLERVQELETVVIKAMDSLSHSSGLLPPSGNIFALPETRSLYSRAVLAHPQITCPPDNNAQRSSAYIREMDRIFLGNPQDSSTVGVANLAHSQDLGILVTLYNASRVLQLDAQGRIIGDLAADVSGFDGFQNPFGIAMDVDGLVWVSEPVRHSIKVYDAATKTIHSADDPYSESDPIRFPHGLCRGPEGSILVADTGNHRVMSYSTSGRIGIFCGGMGIRPGEFKYPTFLTESAPDNNTIWVADRGNHRIQRLDHRGRSIGQIGGCGVGRGGFAFPESIVQFEDGVLVVSQITSPKALILLSENGIELDRVALDYDARGMLIHNGLLLVGELSGNYIRVYERYKTAP